MQCDCCVKTLTICDVSICSNLELDLIAGVPESAVANIYSMVMTFLGRRVTLKQLQVTGEKVTFDISGLNENYEYSAQVFDSANELVKIGEDEYDCIKFKTII